MLKFTLGNGFVKAITASLNKKSSQGCATIPFCPPRPLSRRRDMGQCAALGKNPDFDYYISLDI